MYIIVAFGFQYTISLEIIIMYQLEIHNNNQHPSGEKKENHSLSSSQPVLHNKLFSLHC